MRGVRAFVADDIPDVAELRSRVFTESERRTRDELTAYFEQVFLESPWRNEAFPSLVHRNESGRLTGFLGVVPRRATFGAEQIDVAVCTQLMVEPDNGSLTAVQLVKAVLAGRQDLSFADVSTDASRKLWERLGGSVSPVHSVLWTQPLRGARFAAAELARGVAARIVKKAVQPVLSLVDGLSVRWPPPAGLEVVPLTPELMSAKLAAVLDTATLRPAYDASSLRWLLNQLGYRRSWGDVRGAALRDETGSIAGWYLYHRNVGGIGEVVQVAASQDRYADVLQGLFHDAWTNGLVAVTGRGDFGVLPALDPRRARVRREGSWVLVHSPRSDLMNAISHGSAFFSRLEGEWWMSF